MNLVVAGFKNSQLVPKSKVVDQGVMKELQGEGQIEIKELICVLYALP
jgi:hypothetical protein